MGRSLIHQDSRACLWYASHVHGEAGCIGSRQEMGTLKYPDTETGDDTEAVAGISFADPYRWLERENEVVHEWQRAQNRLADEYVGRWRHIDAAREGVDHYFVDRISVLPRFVGGSWYRIRLSTGSPSPCVVISSTAYGEGREIAISVSAKNGESPILTWCSPSPDGRIIAVGVCSDGSENNRIVLVDAASGDLLPGAPPQILMDAWMGGVCWLPDGSGFYFLALDGDPSQFKQVVLLHDLATCEQLRAKIPLPSNSTGYTLVTSSRDGRWAVASYGVHAPRPVALRDLTLPNSPWRPFITWVSGAVTGFVQDHRFIAITDVNASRGRVVAIPLDAENPNATDEWLELLAESDVVLRSIKLIGDHIYVTGFLETYSHVLILDRDGRFIRNLSLPGRGAIAEPLYPLMNGIPTGHPDEYYFVFSTFIESWGVYRHLPGSEVVESVCAPAIRIEGAIVEDHWARSEDGTLVPYHTVRLPTVGKAGPNPALIYAYGAFNIALLPEYPGAMAAFIAAGGIYVHGHIRGGAELGLEWWRAGRMKNKQHCYEDLYAIAEDLIAKGLTTPDLLAMTGRSNGGLMAGVVATQRPELWRALVSQVPVTDLIGILRDSYGRYAVTGEFGDPNDPAEVMRIAGFSPYHLVREGVQYPPLYIAAGANDRRSPAWHARKFAARLQAVSAAGGNPVLLRVRDNAGHGFATSRAIQRDTYADWLAFLMQELGMTPGKGV